MVVAKESDRRPQTAVDGKTVGIFTAVSGDSLSIYAVAGKSVHNKVKAGDLIKELAPIAEAKGGGRPDRAQAGSKAVHKEELVLAEAERILTRTLSVVEG